MINLFHFLGCWLFPILFYLYPDPLCITLCYFNRGSCSYCGFKITQLNYTTFALVLLTPIWILKLIV
nr:MAG TPA: HEPN/RES N-terminal domain 1 [Bacteriophage sp.]